MRKVKPVFAYVQFLFLTSKIGIWLNTADGNPFATVIGSSNYGPRSASRDTEVNALVMTSNRGLQEQLRAEITNLREHTQVVTDETFTLPGRRVGWGVKIAAWLIKDML